jgi:hypothetical protein
MYVIAIGWLYVTVLMAATEPNLTAGVLTFTYYGLRRWPCFSGCSARRSAAQPGSGREPRTAAREPDRPAHA